MTVDLSCPVPSCDNQISSTRQLVCARCWRRIPRELRKDLTTSWRLYWKHPRPFMHRQCDRLAADACCAADIAA